MNTLEKKLIKQIKTEYKKLNNFDKDLKKNYKSLLINYKNVLKRNNIEDSKLLKNPFNKKLKKIVASKNNNLLN